MRISMLVFLYLESFIFFLQNNGDDDVGSFVVVVAFVFIRIIFYIEVIDVE